MKLLFDQGLPRSAAELLRNEGIDALHTGECGLARASDTEIIDFAREQNRIIFTLDADFHAYLALSRAIAPSTVRIRIEGLQTEPLVNLVKQILSCCIEELAKGAIVSVTCNQIRIRSLPVL